TSSNAIRQLAASPWPSALLLASLLRHQLFDELGDQRGVVLLFQVFDPRLGQLQLLERARDALPLLFASLALGQVQVGDQLAEPLQRNRVAVLVVILDDLFLVLRSLSHGSARRGWDLRLGVREEEEVVER